MAQDANLFARDRNVAVDQRGRPELEALGVRLGSYMMYPKVQFDIGRDSNVAAAGDDELKDTLYRFSPRVDLESDWSRHSVTADVYGAFTRYADYKSENGDNYGLDLNGRMDIQRFTFLNAGVLASHEVESRTSSAAPNFSFSPSRFNSVGGYVGASHTVNRIRGTARLNVRDYSYEDVETLAGVRVDQSDRDVTTYDLTTRVDYALSPATAVYGSVALNERSYANGGTTTTPNRDSSGYNAVAGLNFELSNLVRGEVGAGYLRQEFDNPLYSEISGLSANASVEYFATPLLTLGLSGSRSVSDSGIVGTAGFLTTNVQATLDYELRRNFLLNARLGRTIDEFDNVDRKNARWSGSLRGTYLVNRRVGVTALYDYQTRESTGVFATNDFTTNRFLLSLVLQY
ncbi:outer membrane beta-barrel protein [soil metagenome]